MAVDAHEKRERVGVFSVQRERVRRTVDPIRIVVARGEDTARFGQPSTARAKSAALRTPVKSRSPVRMPVASRWTCASQNAGTTVAPCRSIERRRPRHPGPGPRHDRRRSSSSLRRVDAPAGSTIEQRVDEVPDQTLDRPAVCVVEISDRAHALEIRVDDIIILRDEQRHDRHVGCNDPLHLSSQCLGFRRIVRSGPTAP